MSRRAVMRPAIFTCMAFLEIRAEFGGSGGDFEAGAVGIDARDRAVSRVSRGGRRSVRLRWTGLAAGWRLRSWRGWLRRRRVRPQESKQDRRENSHFGENIFSGAIGRFHPGKAAERLVFANFTARPAAKALPCSPVPFSRTSPPPIGDVPQRLEGGEDGGDLIGALLVLAAEAGGEGFGVLADGGQELAEDGDLVGQAVGPGRERCWILNVGF